MSESTLGQQNRKNIRQTIEIHLGDYCGNPIDKMANLLAYDYNMGIRTVRYDYLPMFIDKGILFLDENGLVQMSNGNKHKPVSIAEARILKAKKIENAKHDLKNIPDIKDEKSEEGV